MPWKNGLENPGRSREGVFGAVFAVAYDVVSVLIRHQSVPTENMLVGTICNGVVFPGNVFAPRSNAHALIFQRLQVLMFLLASRNAASTTQIAALCASVQFHKVVEPSLYIFFVICSNYRKINSKFLQCRSRKFGDSLVDERGTFWGSHVASFHSRRDETETILDFQ